MEQKVIVGQKRDWMQWVSGVSLIVLTFIANGFLSFIVVGFDFSNLWTTQFWANFTTLFLSEMCVLFGMFILRRNKDLQNKKITDLQAHIDRQREIVYGVDKITDAEKWLREIYNYRERLFLFENKIKTSHSHIVLNEPTPSCKNYDKKKKKYEKLKALRDYYVDQLEFVKKDKKRLNLLIKESKTSEEDAELQELKKELDIDDYAFRTAKIHYKEVYWGNLLSDIDESKAKASTPFFNEKKELSKNIVRYLAMGVITTSFITALIFPTFNALSWEVIMNIILNAIILIFYMARGVVVSNQIILGSYYKALEKRKSIYNQMLKDLGISRIIIE